MSIEAMKLALEALENTTDVFLDTEGNHGTLERGAIERNYEAITALRQAIENHKEWVGLHAADWNGINVLKLTDPIYVAQWVEARLKGKNHG